MGSKDVSMYAFRRLRIEVEEIWYEGYWEFWQYSGVMYYVDITLPLSAVSTLIYGEYPEHCRIRSVFSIYEQWAPALKKHHVKKNRPRSTRTIRKWGQEAQLNSSGNNSKYYTTELHRSRSAYK